MTNQEMKEHLMKSEMGTGVSLCAIKTDDDFDIIKSVTEPLYFGKFQEFSRDTIRIIMLNGIAAGWVHIHIPANSLGSGFVFIYVSPDHRRKGIGTQVYRQVESLLIPVGCNWWTSYPESEAADRFALSVGFDYTNTNSYMEHNGMFCDVSAEGIRACRAEDYPAAPDIWSREYADMHRRIGLPFEKHELTEEERKQEYEQFIHRLNHGYVMEAKGKIIGYGTLFEDNSGIGSVAIDRAFAGRGYGTKLTAYLTNECIRRGNKTPSLYCESGNNNAMHVYRKLGYSEVSRETVAIKNRI